MDDEVRLFGEDLGKRAIARDWIGVHALLAPWLQQSMTPDANAVRSFFESEYQLTLQANNVGYWSQRAY